MNIRKNLSGMPIILLLFWSAAALAQRSVVTWHYNNQRTGANLQETILKPSNVNWTQFGKLFAYNVDGAIVGQALYLPNISVPNKGVHNIVFVATMNDTVYAFDADSNGGSNALPLWKQRVLPAGATPVPMSIQGGAGTTGWTEVGVVSTPVIDPATGILYVVAKDYQNGTVSIRLYGLDISTGRKRFSPVHITASFTTAGNTYTLNNLTQVNRPALLLNGGNIYIAFGGNGGNGPEQGCPCRNSHAPPGTPLTSFREWHS